ncbi:Scarecrow-like protein 3 [Glycine max]|nr:Scarecrow-like protein 3 [Glycine max]
MQGESSAKVMDSGSQYYHQGVQGMNWDDDERIHLINLHNDCVRLTELGNFNDADIALYHLSQLASSDGDSMQRVATYFIEALAYCQVVKNLRGVPKVLHLVKTLSTPEQQLVKKLFLDFYPFIKIAHTITNQAIIEAMKGETSINVLDLSPSYNALQWTNLMKCLLKPNTPTCLKITITAIHEKKEVLEQMGLHLGVEAESLENLDPEKLPIKKGEPLAISSVLQLHSLLATDDDNEMVKMRRGTGQRMFPEMLAKPKKKKVVNPSPDSAPSPFSPCPSHKMESFLYGLWKLQPKVMVITEQESNVNNGSSLTKRVRSALKFYSTLFDCLEASTSRTSERRSLMEKMLLGEEIRNIVACEGVERKETHEKLVTWIPRLELAGFRREPISSNGIRLATKLLQTYVPGYHIHQKNKCLFIYWHNVPLFSVSAWKF